MPSQPSSIGRYQVLNCLGQGGMGSVYLARDPSLDRLVAIKLLREGFDNPELRERFLREARSIGRLRHPNIITIFDVGEDDGRPFIAMEHLEGNSLAAIIQQRASISLGRKLGWMEELSAGLHHAHRSGVVHRDIKPTNIMLDTDGVLKILDFGIAQVSGARAGEAKTQAGMLLGTLNFMAPEQMMGLPDIDGRADQFSAGAVFYELLTYQRPFEGGIESGILHKIINSVYPPLATLDPTLDPALIAIVNRCLDKSRDGRYPDMDAVRQDLGAVRRRLGADGDGADMLSAASPAALARPGTPPAAAPPPAPATFEATLVMPPPLAAAPPRPDLIPGAVDATIVFRRPAAPATAPRALPDVQLVVTRSADSRLLGRRVSIDKPIFAIGRGPDCDLNLADDGWSRRHAEVEYVDDGFLVRDLASRNGVFVNGRRIIESPLPFGAIVTIGGTDLTFALARDTTLPDLTGCVVADRYTLTRVLRQSAKGSVYVADDARAFAEVAIKLMSPDLVRFPGYREAFQRAAEIAARMKHPYISRLTDYGPATLQRPGDVPIQTQYLCFELMSGGTLAERIEGRTILSTARVSEWLAALSEALDYAHRHGVLHGDLKPSAIVFDEEEHPYLTDFSMAQQSQAGDSRPISGTPAYMAPELWKDGSITPAAEQFALAAIVYYLVTGSRPFEGQENPSVRDRNFRRGPIPAHEEAAHGGRTDVPRAMGQVLARALAQAPGDRYDSASAFAAAFKASIRHIVQRAEGPEVFISYQRDVSAPLAMYFADKLKAQGIKPFIDAEGLDGAGPFPKHIERAIEDADVFVCLLARTTLQSDWVKREIEFATRFEKPMIPIMQESYDRASAPIEEPAVASLLTHQGLPVLDKRNLHLEHTAADLVRLIKSAVAQRDRG